MLKWLRGSGRPHEKAPGVSNPIQPELARVSPELPRVAPVDRPSASADAWGDNVGLLPDGIEGGERLGYGEGAAQFVQWLQQLGETGELSRCRLEALYGRHCLELGFALLPSNHFFAALARLACRYERRLTRRGGGRQRVTTYDIPRKPRAAQGAAGKGALPRGPQSRPHDDEQDHVASATQRRAA